MARVCAICGKKPASSVKRIKLRSRYNPTTKRKKIPNLHRITVTPSVAKKFPKLNLPAGKRIWVCSKCLRTITKIDKIK